MRMTDSDPSDYVLKVPEGNSVGITPELRHWIETNGRLELFGEIIEPGHGTTTKEYVPVEALEDLVEEWTDFAEPAAWDEYSDGVRDATASCADELQDVIDDYS
jgi:hypothetical protein